ncbi:MAG: SEC-C domain-containing protein [Roseburia sp.]|nr:SEC-C domain-containing protein [Roseburia sp.]
MKRKKNSPSDIREVKKILIETAAEIPELKYILTLVCLREEKLDEAEALFKELYRETGDDDMKKAVRMMKEIKQQAGFSFARSNFFDWNDDSDWDRPMGEVIPFRREKEKIGRNAPCPCGSGKKFKQCCMGKGIYD